MSEGKGKIDEALKTLKREHEELALKMHLAKAEAREEWKELEAKLDELERRARPAAKVVEETAGGVGASLELAADEIKKGFAKIRKLL